jgi:hypothetical protein
MANLTGGNGRRSVPKAKGLRLLGVSRRSLEEFCHRNHIRRLSLFGSTLSGEATPESDIDLLVEFEPDGVPSFFGIARMENELTSMLGRKVDLRTPNELSRHFRSDVLAHAEVLYAEG